MYKHLWGEAEFHEKQINDVEHELLIMILHS